MEMLELLKKYVAVEGSGIKVSYSQDVDRFTFSVNVGTDIVLAKGANEETIKYCAPFMRRQVLNACKRLLDQEIEKLG